MLPACCITNAPDLQGGSSCVLRCSLPAKDARNPVGLTWCPQWWMHAEAIARLMALWEAWEALRLDGGTAMGTWWRDHCGPQLGVLMNGEEGPLHLCEPDQHGGIPAPLKSTPTPPEWWGSAANLTPG